MEHSPLDVKDVIFENFSAAHSVAYVVATSAPLIFSGNFALNIGERLSPDGTPSAISDLGGLASESITFDRDPTGEALDPTFVQLFNPGGQTHGYSIGGNNNLVITDLAYVLTVIINNYLSQDSVLLNLPGGTLDADLSHASPGKIDVDGSSRDGEAPAPNKIAITAGSDVNMRADDSSPQTYRVVLSNAPTVY